MFNNGNLTVSAPKVIAALALCATLTACGSSGNQRIGEMNKRQINSMICSQIKTKQHALHELGEPDDIDFTDSGQEKWTYKHTRATSKPQNFIPIVSLFSRGTDDTHKKVVLIFDQHGHMVNSATTESSGETRLGIAE